MSQEPFDLPWPEASRKKQGEGTRKVKEAVAKDVVWRRITTATRPKCDPCVQHMVHGGPWFAPDPVAWERVGHGTQVFLCYFHAAPLRAGEGLDP